MIIFNTDIKDELFYSDLIYYIKKISGLKVVENEDANKRIYLRMQSIERKENGITIYELSNFELELFNFIKEISKNTEYSFTGSNDNAKYYELVSSKLKEYDNKKNNKLQKKLK